MLKGIRRAQRWISGYVSSSDSESTSRLKPEEIGVVVRHLPKVDNLKEKLANYFNSQDISLFNNYRGDPAYAVVKFRSEYQIQEALTLNKKPFENRKIYLKVKAT